jgi:predicted transcriptional regulator of viral defense system
MGSKRNGDCSKRRRGALLARLAGTQHGVVSRRQLRRLGFSDKEIEAGIRLGRLHRVFRGVYAVGYPQEGKKARMRAATLACGEGTVVSHRSAAALLGLLDTAPVVVDVIAPGSAGRKLDRIRAHETVRLEPYETGSVDGIPCTSPGRTLADIAGEVGMRTLRSGFERAAAKGILDVAAVEAAAARGTRGAGAARRLARAWRKAAPAARKGRLKSPLEAMVLPLLLSRGVAPPRINAPVRLRDGSTIEVDFLWPAERLVVEADSRDFHATDLAFERDRWRDRELLRVGYASFRVTRLQAETETAEIAAAVAERLRAQPPASRSAAISAGDRRRA